MKYWNELDGSVFFNKVFSRAIEIKKAYIHSLNIETINTLSALALTYQSFLIVYPKNGKTKGTTHVG